MNNILEELKYYCNMKEAAGALMLTGEWGCGKTYLIDYILANALKDTHILIRISLFGISSIDFVSTAVRKAWMETILDGNGTIGLWTKRVIQAKDTIIKAVETVNNTIGAVLSFDIASFIPISNKIGNKTVVLVFDDLERCRIDPADLLGVINDYCENQKFHTIIVANEDYILEQSTDISFQSNDAKTSAQEMQETHPYIPKTGMFLSYREIKEKIVQRTVKVISDYDSIVKSVIQDYMTDDIDYKQFLTNQTEGLKNLFSIGIPMAEMALKKANIDAEILAKARSTRKPHNIRSFRYALQDFHRIFNRLKASGIIEQLDEWLYAFVMFTMAYKAGVVTDNKKYGDIFADTGVSQLYSSFYKNKYMLKFEKMWVLYGEWDEEAATKQIEEFNEMQRAATPYDIVRTNQLLYIDEEVFNEGFPQILNNAYNGMLTIDDYVQLIRNIASAREYNFELCVPVAWQQIETGIKNKLESLRQEGKEDIPSREYIEDSRLKLLSQEERSAYNLIDRLRKSEKLIFAKDRRDFLKLIKIDPIAAISKLKNIQLEDFDSEMADSVAQAFAKCNNSERAMLIDKFRGMFSLNLRSQDCDVWETTNGLDHLLVRLEEIKSDIDEKKVVTLIHFNNFIEHILLITALMGAEYTEPPM